MIDSLRASVPIEHHQRTKWFRNHDRKTNDDSDSSSPWKHHWLPDRSCWLWQTLGYRIGDPASAHKNDTVTLLNIEVDRSGDGERTEFHSYFLVSQSNLPFCLT